MNQQMWAARATQRNVETLRRDGVEIFGPGSGDQACGDVGMGRMLEPAQIADLSVVLQERLGTLAGLPSDHSEPSVNPLPSGTASQNLEAVRVMITAGPTREALDPVRYISNHSTGKQGFELARAFHAAGATVTLVAGPVQLATPSGVNRLDVTSAQDMFDAVMDNIHQQHIFIAVAAVADYRPAQVANQKIKKEGQAGPVELTLVQNPDIVASVAALDSPPFTVGFAAETHQVLEHARAKRQRKGLDAIIVNDVSDQSIGFSSDHNAVTVIWDDDEQTLPRAPKAALSDQISAVIGDRFWQRQQRIGAKPHTPR